MKDKETFTYKDLEKILKIKDRVNRTLLFGGGGALDNDEKKDLEMLLAKAKRCLDES